jgi:hypothetical protein
MMRHALFGLATHELYDEAEKSGDAEEQTSIGKMAKKNVDNAGDEEDDKEKNDHGCTPKWHKIRTEP